MADEGQEQGVVKSCLAENQSGGVRGIALADNLDVKYGVFPPEEIEAEAEAALSAMGVAEKALAPPKVTRYYQGRAASRARRTKADINKVVMHTPEGGEAGTLSVLNGTGASFDWFLPPSGNLYRCNDYYNYIAWQAGNWPVNQTSIGIEQWDFARNMPNAPDAHYHRLARLSAFLVESLDLAIRRTRDKNSYGFITHADVTPGARWDPGEFDWDRFLELTLDYRRGSSTKPEEPEDPETRVLYKVQSGAFSKETGAESLASDMKKRGFETYIVEEDGLYKVQTGAFSRREGAEAHERHVKSAGFDAFITKDEAGKPGK